MERLIIKVHKGQRVPDKLNGVVRVSPDAELAIRALERQTGLPARAIASQLILWAAERAEVEEVD